MLLKLNLLIGLLLLLCPEFIFSQYPTEFVKPEGVNFSSVVGSGARAFGMGGAFIAIADDATAASWNPAGLAQLVKPEISLVYAFHDFDHIYPFSEIPRLYSMSKFQLSRSGSNIDFLSFALPIKTKYSRVVTQLSYQRAINLSLRNEILGTPSYSFYEYVSGHLDLAGDYTGGFDIISFSLGFNFSPAISVGSAFNFWFNGQKGSQTTLNKVQSHNLPLVIDHITTEEKNLHISGFNFQFGLLIKPFERITLGLTFRSPFVLDYEMKMKSFFNSMLDSTNSYVEKADLKFPYTFGFGASYRPIKQITISSDFTFGNWSEGYLVGSERIFSNGNKKVIAKEPFPGNDYRPQNDTQQLRFGIEYVFLKKMFLIPVRSGFFTNTPYITDGKNKSITYLGFTAGIGVGVKQFLFDVAFISQGGNFFYEAYSDGEREFNSRQFYISAIYRFDFLK